MFGAYFLAIVEPVVKVFLSQAFVRGLFVVEMLR
jgi:hypothetical protein